MGQECSAELSARLWRGPSTQTAGASIIHSASHYRLHQQAARTEEKVRLT
jgi:hypothetical protein